MISKRDTLVNRECIGVNNQVQKFRKNEMVYLYSVWYWWWVKGEVLYDMGQQTIQDSWLQEMSLHTNGLAKTSPLTHHQQFWEDRWCGETSLAVTYFELFRFCRDKEASVAELIKSTNGVLFWNVSFFRGVHARELEVVSSFMDTIYDASVRGFGEDKMC